MEDRHLARRSGQDCDKLEACRPSQAGSLTSKIARDRRAASIIPGEFLEFEL
jgi:hypothetical protein